MIGLCPYNCYNRDFSGYCKTFTCIYGTPIPKNNAITTTNIRSPKSISLTLAKDAYDKIHSARETRSRSSDKVMVVLTDTEVQLIEGLLEALI